MISRFAIRSPLLLLFSSDWPQISIRRPKGKLRIYVVQRISVSMENASTHITAGVPVSVLHVPKGAR
jgi:hypothetical protein